MEKVTDWLFRYQYVFRVRRAKRSKRRFLKALVSDLVQMRTDVQVIEYGDRKNATWQNVYVGNITTATQIICTYYDTPAKHFGGYTFFDSGTQRKRTINFLLITSILLILSGGLGTWFFSHRMVGQFPLTSLPMIISVLIYGIYFILLSKVTQGISSSKTLIRNTSSIIALLLMIKELKQGKLAFAFVDEGCLGEKGLEVVRKMAKKDSDIFYLDCIGAWAPLNICTVPVAPKQHLETKLNDIRDNNCITYVFSGKKVQSERQNYYYLKKSDLYDSKINWHNVTKVINMFR